MKARAFDYVRSKTVEEALCAFEESAGEAQYLAGGQSLIPALNLRLQAPDRLIDITHIESLRGVDRIGGFVRLGALTLHAEILDSDIIRRCVPLLAEAAQYVAHPGIRNRGTLGGSLSLADPASEFPAVVLALGGEVEIVGKAGRRRISADDFFIDLYRTALQPGEILSAVWLPIAAAGDCFVFDELSRRRGDYALVGLAAHARIQGDEITFARLVFLSVGSKPIRAKSAESALTAGLFARDRIEAAQAALASDIDPIEDPQVPSSMRLHLARVLLGRVLRKLSERRPDCGESK